MKSMNGVLIFFVTVWVSAVHADLLGQVDTFDSGLMGWGGGASPSHVTTGGPGGAGDAFFSISRPVNDPFHLATANVTQWKGNYLAAGINAIEMDLNHLSGPAVVKVRIMIWGDGGVWGSKELQRVTSGWNHYRFELTLNELVYVNDDTTRRPPASGGGTGVLADTLRNVTILQLRHDSAVATPPGAHPPHISAAMGIDNIQAVPEPGTLLYMLSASGALFVARRRKMRPHTKGRRW